MDCNWKAVCCIFIPTRPSVAVWWCNKSNYPARKTPMTNRPDIHSVQRGKGETWKLNSGNTTEIDFAGSLWALLRVGITGRGLAEGIPGGLRVLSSLSVRGKRKGIAVIGVWERGAKWAARGNAIVFISQNRGFVCPRNDC